jgi:phosphatidate cytidylyltransferase
MKRLATAAVLIPLVIFVMFWAPMVVFQMVVAAFGFVCFHEYANIAKAQGIPVPEWLGQALGLVLLLSPVLDWRLPVLLVLIMTAWSLRVDPLSSALPLAAATVMGILYVYGAWRSALVLRDAGSWWILMAVSLNWVGDTAAFYAGRAFGKNKLAPRISPGKTWEGAIASAILATAYGTAVLALSEAQVPVWHAAPLSLAAGVAGQFGDLVESAMKRGAGLKDSGQMLPGHGGWLDRLDSTLFSMPVVALYLSLAR